jgi:glucose/arabinose dehydrogenase
MPGRAFVTIALALVAAFFTVFLCAKPGTTLPGGFTDSLVTDEVSQPIALDFTPDGRLLVTSKPGRLYVHEDGQTTLALDLSSKICSNSERGLLGVAVDPNFEDPGSNYVYLYYTAKVGPTCQDPGDAVNRVSRFVMNDDNTVDENSEEVLIDNIPSPNGNHNAGDLKFGNDGYLYVSVGDGGCNYAKLNKCQYRNGASRVRHVLLGKVLRITPDGGIPATNPFRGPDSGRCNETGRTDRKHCRETFARGFRNPFRMAFDPDAPKTRFFINDVGGKWWEEIDRAQSGADYGWNLCEGRRDNPYRSGKVNCDGSKYRGPIHQYNHDAGCSSITGGSFVPNDGSWPAEYDNVYLFGDFVCNKIFELKPQRDGSGFDQTLFTTLSGGGPITMTFGPPNSDLYYTTFAGGGQVRRIAYTGS